MYRYLATRLLTMLLVLWVISVALFSLSHAAPGGPIASILSPDQMADAGPLVANKMKEYGLDRPLLEQYVTWMGKLLTGDLGVSFQYARPVADLMLERLTPTVEVMGITLVISTLLAVTLGVFQARRKGSVLDYLLGAGSLLISNTPGFFLAILLIYVFAAKLGWLPSGQMSSPGDGTLPDLLIHLILPVLTLTLLGTAGTMRYVRAGLLEELNRDYVRTALAQGASPREAALKAFRNSLPPIVTIVMMGIPSLLGGAVLIESVFSWPGMGTLMLGAIQYRDYPVILGFGMTVALLVVVNNFVTDLLVAALDPRVRLR